MHDSITHFPSKIPVQQDTPVQTIRILLVDDQPFVLQLLNSFLTPEPDLSVIGSTDSGKTALALVSKLKPDIALIDIEMPDIDGVTLARTIGQQCPHTKVLVLSSHDDESYIRETLAVGVRGYLLKGTPASEIIHAIRHIHKGYLQLGPGLFEKLASPLVSFSSSPPPSAIVAAPLKTLVANSSEQEWSPYAEDQINALPQLWTRGLLYFLIAITAIALPWAMLSKVDETGVARGRLEPKGATQRIDVPTAGTIASVQVQEGQMVQKGQVLLALETDVLKTELQQSQAKLTGQNNQLNQLAILKSQVLSMLSVQSQQNQAQILEKLSQVDQARQASLSNLANAPLQEDEKLAQVAQAEVRLNAAQISLIRSEHLYRKDLDEVERYRKLAQVGAVAVVKVVELERTSEESRRLRDQAQAEVAQSHKQLLERQKSYQSLRQKLEGDQQQADLRLQEQKGGQATLSKAGELALLKNQEQLKQLESQASALKADIQQSQSQLKALSLQLAQRIVRSPISGTIFELPFKKAKAFVQPGQLVAQISPQNAPLIVKGQIPSINSGFLKVGQPVKLKFDAYPFQDYGVVSGRLQRISPDSKVIEIGGIKTEVFDLEVALDQAFIQTPTKQIMLTPGQAATAEVIVRQRRIIDFLLDPFQKLQAGGLRL
jgi:hemolysin D